MSINKRVRKSMLNISIIGIAILMCISLWRIFTIRAELSDDLDKASSTISEYNTSDMLSMSLRLAQATAERNARSISGEFSRIRGELETLKGDIENIYNSEGVRNCLDEVTRCEEYIVSEMAELSQDEIDATVNRLCGLTAMFDNVLANENKISLAYIVLENGMVFSSTDTFYPAVEKADMRTRDWYKNAVAAGTVSWAELYVGSDGRNYVTVAVPAFDNENEVFGVVAFDLRVSEISEVVLNPASSDFSDAFILGKDNTVLLGTKDNDTLRADETLSHFIDKLCQNTAYSGHMTDDSMIAGYARIDETGWRLVTMLDYNAMLEPVERVASTVTRVSAETTGSLSSVIRSTIVAFCIFLAVTVAIVFAVSYRTAKRITNPIETLTAGAAEIGNGNIDHEIPELGDDEIGDLARNFNSMTKKLKEYIANLTTVTAEKERIGAELDVATHIQKSMLPCIFPAFPERSEFDIYATMDPAKEVGGDFYDFFMVDERHIAIVMADVSGKGVPAALFMVIAKTLIKDHTQPGVDLGTVFSNVNNMLCESNSEGLFVTAFEGVLDLVTGEFVYVNAGHEMPFIYHKDGSYEAFKIRPGFVLAGMEGMRYRSGVMTLNVGDKVFQYTDGVTEATDANNELYGMERLENILNREKDASPDKLLPAVKADIDAFVGEAPQFDDITMLCLEVKGRMAE